MVNAWLRHVPQQSPLLRNPSAVPHEEVQNWICCPEILNVSVNVYAVCNNKECCKKISSNPGSNMVKYISCKRSMPMKNCYLNMNVNFQLEKEEKSYSVTVFPKAVSSFIKEDTDALVAKLLVLEKVDFQLSQSGKIVARIQDHETSFGSVGKIEDKNNKVLAKAPMAPTNLKKKTRFLQVSD